MSRSTNQLGNHLRSVLTERGPLHYVVSQDGYAVYRDRAGGTVCLADGTARVLVGSDTVDLPDEYRRWAYLSYAERWRYPGFLDWLAAGLTDPDAIEEVQWCQACNDPVWSDDLESSGSGSLCENCYENCASCSYCGLRFRDDDLTGLDNDDDACSSCLSQYCSFCDDCSVWHDSDDLDEHRHGDCYCEPRITRFRVPNGDGEARNDEQVQVTLPGGIISDEGLGTIANLLRHHHGEGDPEVAQKWWQLSYTMADSLGPKWQTPQGNFTKRLSRLAYKTYGLKVQPEMMTRVGNQASAHSQPVELDLEFTRELNLSAEDFYHEDSCWWTSYAYSRCTLKSNGGFGMRTFTGPDEYQCRSVSGRAWVLPLHHDGDSFTPTLDTWAPSAYVVFNGYGDLEGYAPARALAHLTGMTYRKMSLSVSNMYVNNDSGYLVGPEDLIKGYASLVLHLEQHEVLPHPADHEREMTHA